MGIVVGLAGHEWDIYSSVSVGLGLSIPFSLWWIYFDNIGRLCYKSSWKKVEEVYTIFGCKYFPLVVGLTAIGIGIKQAASSNQEIPLPFSDLWLIWVQYPAVCLFRQCCIW